MKIFVGLLLFGILLTGGLLASEIDWRSFYIYLQELPLKKWMALVAFISMVIGLVGVLGNIPITPSEHR